jgi:phthalate 4,5-dioxygenase oxygenase subunit
MSPQDNELLCRIEGDAPMGQIMRRHWIPACMIEEVAEPDGKPLRVRLLGEDYVVFRDSEGKVGILEDRCPHRGASLSLGRNEACGLRCLYHGWKMDTEGNVLEMASEPAASGFLGKVKHKAYPVELAGGFVWTWLGPLEEMTPFERPLFAPHEDTPVSIVKIHVNCNWAQILEGAIDSAHSSSLHSTDMVPSRVDGAKATDDNWLRPSTDKAPRMQVQTTPFGFRYAAIRRPIRQADTHDYVRVTLFVAPWTVVIPPNNRYNLVNLNIPADDTHTVFYFIAWGGTECPPTEVWRKFCGAQPGVDLDARFRNTRTRDNDYLQDRQAMKLGSFTGIRGIPQQDISMWETMGPISDRSRDRLGASDLAIVEFRRQMVEAARDYAAGGKAIGTTEPRVPLVKVASWERIVPKSDDWRAVEVSDEERAVTQALSEAAQT